MQQQASSSITLSAPSASTDGVRGIVAGIESAPLLPDGSDERFVGYGVMGLPFSSGHYLALRRFPANSLGDAYTSVWWRNPAGEWSMFSTVPPATSCPRFFGSVLARTETHPIALSWPSSDSLTVSIPDVLEWRLDLGSTVATRMLSRMGAHMPRPIWRNPAALAMTARFAAPMLGSGKIRLQGKVPNGQSFQANPRRMWLVTSSQAGIDGQDVGPIGPLASQTHLADVWLPQRGFFFTGEAYMEPLDPSRHWSALRD